ncbi:ABC transporter substrate-binding protein (plasmid) [Deinococcus psychrotolerans]|uniref:ABC transporter substrate-binding protein n=1 Tax=Deinococcus psychrotolerans TaxID=2489213 RepID=A0A3G8YQV6_9DEIO|nr:ABC transporter substrate-binding protein [Deinococcus psychrotolerans]AZI44954.1 ABC transporter substrate-binding protein [Deinococcus psychrotolerans]
MLNKRLWITLSAALLLSPAQAVSNPDTLYFGVYFEPASIDAHAITEWAGMWLDDNIYETLVRYKTKSVGGKLEGTTTLQPWLAQKYTASNGGKTYTFELRKNVKFQDGTALTADDVQFSLQRVLALDLGPAKQLKDCVDPAGIKVLDPLRVQVDLKNSCPSFLALLAQTNTGAIMSKAYVNKNGGVKPGQLNDYLRTHGMGTGPFTMGDTTAGVKFELNANPNYWGGKPKLAKIVFRVIKDLSNQYLLLRQGQLDVVYNLPSELLEQSMKESSLTVNKQSAIGAQTLYMNNTQKPFNDPKVRQALMYAVNQQELSDAATLGIAKPSRSVLPGALPGYTGNEWPYKTNLDKAKALLKEAGYPSGFASTIYYNSGNAEREKTAVTLQAQLAKVGIKVDVRSVAWPTFVDGYQTGKFPMFVVSNLAAPILDQYMTQNFDSGSAGAGGNYSFYKNPAVDKMIAQLSATTAPADRNALARRLQKTINTDLPLAPLYDVSLYYVMQKWVKGWTLYPSGNWYFKDVSKE